MSDLSAEKVVAELRASATKLEKTFGVKSPLKLDESELMRRAADLIAHQAARLEEVTERAVSAEAQARIWADHFKDAKAALTAAEAEVGRLRVRLGHWAITEEFDYPGDAEEFCGYWCHECKDHVEADGSGHGKECPCHGIAPDTARAVAARACLSSKKEG